MTLNLAARSGHGQLSVDRPESDSCPRFGAGADRSAIDRFRG
jgi:hypothetical protein